MKEPRSTGPRCEECGPGFGWSGCGPGSLGRRSRGGALAGNPVRLGRWLPIGRGPLLRLVLRPPEVRAREVRAGEAGARSGGRAAVGAAEPRAVVAEVRDA